MKIRTKIQILIYSLLILLSVDTQAQVTIGSDKAPAQGALLQVKSQESDKDGVTAKKGVLLPRVSLIRLNTLQPFDPTNSANPTTRALHTGLFVYNTTNNPEGYINGVSGSKDPQYVLVPGVYTWDGAKWMALKYTKFPVINFVCTGNNSISLPAGGTVSPGTTYQMAYTSQTPGATIPAYTATKNGITISYAAQTLASSGTIEVRVSGTLSVGITSSFDFDLGTYFCPFRINIIGSSIDIKCNPNPSMITGQVGTTISRTVKIDYTVTGSNYNLFAGIVGSTAENDLRAEINTQTLNAGNGTIDVIISGNPTTARDNYQMKITIAGQDCFVTLNISKLEIKCNPQPNTITGQKNIYLTKIVKLNYTVTGGTSYNLAAATVGDSGNGLTATIEAQTLNPGSNSIDVTISGIPTSALTNYQLKLTIAGQDCYVTVNVSDITIKCNPKPNTISGSINTNVTQVVTIDYTVIGGTSYVLPAATVGNSGNGLTAVIEAQTLNPGDGAIDVKISGIPTSALTNYQLKLTIAGQDCYVTVNIVGNILDINCSSILPVNNIKPGLPIPDGTIVSVPYTSTYNAGTLTAGDNVIDGNTSINGITATIANTVIVGSGSGNIVIKLGGTPLNLANPTKIPIKLFDVVCEITVNMIDLADGDLPNCYIVKPGSVYTFPVTKPYLVWQNEPDLRAIDYWDMKSIPPGEKAEVLWSESSKSTTRPIVTLNGNGKYATITIDARNVTEEVNALVAYYDGTTVVDNLSKTVPAIRWSYHIWITKYDPDNKEYGTTYEYDDTNPNKQIMDRNVGALDGIYLNRLSSVDAQGLLYQWGRKDPFPYASLPNKIPGQMCSGTCTFIPNITNFGIAPTPNLSSGNSTPYITLTAATKVTRTHAVTGAKQFPIYYYPSGQPFDWMLTPYGTGSNPNGATIFNSWSKPKGTSNTVGGEVAGKGYYDPCPSGWRVPDDVSVFSKVTIPNGTPIKPGDAVTSTIGNFPMPGSTSPSNATITGEGAGGWGVYWTAKTGRVIGYETNSNIGATAMELRVQGSPTTTSYRSDIVKFKSSFGSVRCIKNL